MSKSEKHEVQLKIAQIIERSRHQEEMFLIDSKTAASDILKYLQTKELIEFFQEEKIELKQIA